MDNEFNEVDFLLKGARAFKKADQRLDSIGAQTNSHSHLEVSKIITFEENLVKNFIVL